MKKKLLLTTCIAGIIALATACSSQSTTTAETTASATAEATTEAAVKENTTAAEKETAASEKPEGITESKDKAEADSKADEKSDEIKESTMTGTISEIKDFMFTLTADGKDYAFTYEASNKPEGLSEVKDDDKVTVTYTGTVDEADAFNGTIISVTKAE